MTPPGTDDGPDDETLERAKRLVRREPPRFRRVEVRSVEPLSPHMRRVRLAGPELEGLTVDQPAASVRLLLPPPGGALEMPEWDGNEFLSPGGERPPIRTLTPRRMDPDDAWLDLDIVLHEGGVASDWVRNARPGDEVAVSGTGRGFDIDDDVAAYVLAGDEPALPAIGQLLEWIPDDVPVDVHVELSRPDARIELPDHPRADITWHELPDGSRPGNSLISAVESVEIPDGGHVWVAGEAAAVQRIRKHLGDERGLPRSQTTVRGYWKLGRPAS